MHMLFLTHSWRLQSFRVLNNFFIWDSNGYFCFYESISWSNADWSCSRWIMLLLISTGLQQCRRMQLSWSVYLACWCHRYVWIFRICAKYVHICRCFRLFATSSYQSTINTVVDMAEVELHHSTHQQFESQNIPCKAEEIEAAATCFLQPNGECRLTEESTNHYNSTELLKKGFMEYGCQHYRRRCHIRAPCCNQVFDCRHCHNEAMNNIVVDQQLRHDIPRHQITQVICSLCGTEQQVQQVCVNCGVCMAEYFCETCKLFDDDTSKKQYHCDGCGICRIGGHENFFHCSKCGCCYSILLKNSHPCVEGAMHHDCPVCCEYLFESRNDVTVLPCGHTIHKNCLKEMREHYQYACPLCSKSVCDMSKVWEKYDMEIAATPMPEPYMNKVVGILCNDCGRTSNVQFHIVAQKCPNCKSYNTRMTRG